jgi:transposase
LICEKGGKPIAAEVSAGQAHGSKFFERVLQKIAIRAERGRPRKMPEKIAGDKGYSATKIRNWIKSKGIGDVIPTRDDEQRREGFNKQAYRDRNIVERCIGWLKECRRVATRYEKLASNFLGMLKIAMILEYL